MAVYAGQGRKPFSAAQLLAMEEERKKQLAINQAKAKANEPIYFEKDRTWKDKLAGRKSLQGQYWEAYPESAPRGFWGDLAYRHGATSNLFGAPEMHLGDKGMFPAQKFIEESGHQVMFENPELFGYKSRRDLINDKIRENEEWKDMTTRQRYDSYYTNPDIQSSGLQSQEHVAHKQVVPKLIDWLVSR